MIFFLMSFSSNLIIVKKYCAIHQCSKHLSMPLNGFLVTEKGDNSLRQHFLRQSRLTNWKRSCRKYFHSFNYLPSGYFFSFLFLFFLFFANSPVCV